MERLQGLLPRFALDVKAGGNNVLNSVLSSTDMAIRGIEISMSNDSLIDLQGAVDGLKIWGKGHDEKDNFVILGDATWKPILEYLNTRGKAGKD